MTRREILSKYGYCYMSGVDLNEPLTDVEGKRFEDLVSSLRERTDRQEAIWPEWKEKLYRKFIGKRR